MPGLTYKVPWNVLFNKKTNSPTLDPPEIMKVSSYYFAKSKIVQKRVRYIFFNSVKNLWAL